MIAPASLVNALAEDGNPATHFGENKQTTTEHKKIPQIQSITTTKRKKQTKKKQSKKKGKIFLNVRKMGINNCVCVNY